MNDRFNGIFSSILNVLVKIKWGTIRVLRRVETSNMTRRRRRVRDPYPEPFS